MLDRDQHENYILHFVANDNGDRPVRIEQRRASARATGALNIDEFLRRRFETATSTPQDNLVALQSELFLFLTLLDINDNSPAFDQTYLQVEIEENQARNAFLTRLHAIDVDKGRNGTVRYELVIKENPIFNLDIHTGVLRTKRSLDREQCQWYRLAARAYDLGYPNRRYSSTVIIDIRVKNINDHVPYFLDDPYHFKIEENSAIGTVIGRLLIGDQDQNEPVEQLINYSTNEDTNIDLSNLKSSAKIYE
jgi:hypothetical protein